MNKTDRAIVVGISRYGDRDNFRDLDGAENDANAFFEWLVSPDWGAVPPENIDLILSSNFIPRDLEPGNPPFPSPSLALPGEGEVKRAFDKLHDMAMRVEGSYYLGRRLYIYLSGHGFSPEDEDQEAALYTANVTRGSVGCHILGKYNADWFFHAACFDEILLFVDCCRSVNPEKALNKLYKATVDPRHVDRVKCLYGFATKWSKSALELEIDGVKRGVFSMALLDGLKTALNEPDANKITTNSLCNYLTEHMKEFMSPEDRANAHLSNEPYLHTYPERGEGFVIAEVTRKPKNVVEQVTQFLFGAKPEAPKFPVLLRVPAELSGKPIQILDHLLQPLGPPIIAQPEVRLELERGMYQMQVEGSTTPHPFVVSGVGGVLDVEF